MELIYPDRPLYWHDVIYALQAVLADVPEVYLVGGTVRDAYRDYPFKDIDLACAGNGLQLGRKIANAFGGTFYALDKVRKTGRAFIDFRGERFMVDTAALRGATILDDLLDRDFTINAMCVPLVSDLAGIYDPTGGIRDWQAKLLRRITPDSIPHDPIRTLRAVRQSLELGLMIEPQTRQDLRTYAPLLAETSAERIRDEFFAILGGKKPAGAMSILATLGLLKPIIPETAAVPSDRWQFALRVMDKLATLLIVISPSRDDNIAANAEFGTFVYLLDRFRGRLQAHLAQPYPDGRQQRMMTLFAALLLYMSDDPRQALALAQTRGEALKLSSAEIKALSHSITYAAQPTRLIQQGELSPRQIYRYWRAAGENGYDAALLACVEYLAQQGIYLSMPDWTAFLQGIAQLFEGYDMAMNFTPLLTGDDLMRELGLEPSRQLGALIADLHEAQAVGEISSAEEAFAFAQDWLAQHRD